MEQSVAFLDLLAFSNHVRENTQDALMAFTTYRTILETKITDDIMHPPASYSNPILEDLASKSSVNSFNYFLPFSDSVFIASDNPNLFIKQLGSFVLHCFTFTSRHYEQPEDTTNPTKVSISSIGIDKQGKVFEEKVASNYYPTLFRGGVAYGEVIPIELMGKVNNQPQKISNLAGPAVVKAVNLESKIKGPRIVFEKVFYDKLDAQTKRYVYETEINGIYELLWPALKFIPENGVNEIRNFNDLFLPTVNLWKAYNHTPYSEHYFKLVELVVISTLRIFDSYGMKDECVRHISEVISNHKLDEKKKVLLKTYYV